MNITFLFWFLCICKFVICADNGVEQSPTGQSDRNLRKRSSTQQSDTRSHSSSPKPSGSRSASNDHLTDQTNGNVSKTTKVPQEAPIPLVPLQGKGDGDRRRQPEGDSERSEDGQNGRPEGAQGVSMDGPGTAPKGTNGVSVETPGQSSTGSLRSDDLRSPSHHSDDHSGKSDSQPSSLPDGQIVQRKGITFDIFDVDRTKVRVSERETYGIEQRNYYPMTGYYFDKIEQMGEPIWSSGNSGVMATGCTTYGKGGMVSIVEVSLIEKLGQVSIAMYYEKNGGIWKHITVDDFYEKIGSMEEKKKPFKIDRTNDHTEDYKKRDIINISQIDNNLVDITLNLEGTISTIKYVPKSKVSIGSIIDNGQNGPTTIWKAEDDNMDCLFIKTFLKDEMKLLMVYTQHHRFPEYAYYKKDGNGEWKRISKDHFDAAFQQMKEVRQINYTLDLYEPEESKFVIKEDLTNEVKHMICSPKNGYIIETIMDGEVKVWDAGAGEKLKVAYYHYKGINGVMHAVVDKYGTNTDRYFVKRKSKWFQVMDGTYKKKFEELKKPKQTDERIFPEFHHTTKMDNVPPKGTNNETRKPAGIENNKKDFFENVLPKIVIEKNEQMQNDPPRSTMDDKMIPTREGYIPEDNSHFIPEPKFMEHNGASTVTKTDPKIYPPIPHPTHNGHNATHHSSEDHSGHHSDHPEYPIKRQDALYGPEGMIPRRDRDFSAEFNRARERIEARFSKYLTLDLVIPDATKVNQMMRDNDGIMEVTFSPKDGKFNKVLENGLEVWIARNGEECIKAKAYSKNKTVLLQLYTTIGNRVGSKSFIKSHDKWNKISEDELFMKLSQMQGMMTENTHVDETEMSESSSGIFANPQFLFVQFILISYLLYSTL